MSSIDTNSLNSLRTIERPGYSCVGEIQDVRDESEE